MKTVTQTLVLVVALALSSLAFGKGGNQQKSCQLSTDKSVTLLVEPTIFQEEENFNLLRVDVANVALSVPELAKFAVTKKEVVLSQSNTAGSKCDPSTYSIASQVNLKITLYNNNIIEGTFICLEEGYDSFDSSEDCDTSK